MKIYLVVFIILVSHFSSWAQQEEDQKSLRQESLRKAKDTTKKPTIDLYKVISYKNDTTYIDTSLTIQKDYKFNYLRKDLFGLLPFSNTGQTYNTLSANRNFESILPDFGAQARHFNFMEVSDIHYYHVPTPVTELYFKTVPEQGQQLDAFFTTNLSSQLNFSIAYKGLRALGRYPHILTSTGNFRLGVNYKTKNLRYHAKAHFVSQDLMNEENGGLTTNAINQYISGDEEYDDRSVLDINFENAESTLYGKRFYLNHDYLFSKPTDSLNKIYFKHILNYSYKKFQYQQDNAANTIFGNSFESNNLKDVVRYKNMDNTVSVHFKNNLLGEISGRAGYTNLKYEYNAVFIGEDETVPSVLDDDIVKVGGSYENTIGGFHLKGDVAFSFADRLHGNHILAEAGYKLNESNSIQFGIKQNSRKPNLNFLLYQSDYINYNWNKDFENENSQILYANLQAEKIATIQAELTQIQNYAYFKKQDSVSVKPFQANGDVRFFKIKAQREFDFGLFSLANTVLYQKITDGGQYLNMPEFITRNSFYYKDYWFEKALYLQTGFTLNYFSSYNMNGYDPVLAEFYVQNEKEYGGYPTVDFFFNGKVDQARIFFKLENVNYLLKQNTDFSAPGYPHGDFLIRFGLVWNFFL